MSGDKGSLLFPPGNRRSNELALPAGKLLYFKDPPKEHRLSPVEAILLVATGAFLLSQAYVLYQIHGMCLLEAVNAPAPSTWPAVTL